MNIIPVESGNSFHKGITLGGGLSKKRRQVWGVASASSLDHLGEQMELWVAINNSRDQHSKDPRGPEFESDINQVKPRSDAGRLGYIPKLSCKLWGHKVCRLAG